MHAGTRLKLWKALRAPNIWYDGMQASSPDGYQLDIQEITAAGAMAFVAVASASLLILYFFLDNAFYWILVSCCLLRPRVLTPQTVCLVF